jgi:ATP-dependent Lhr-like helicase
VIPTADLIKVLERLEAHESELLCWGDTGGLFTTAELESNIAATLPAQDPDDVEDDLRKRVMIVSVRDHRGIEIGVRTRLAEAMHLFRNLRQWRHGQSLEQARTLVSDYRFVRQRRIYPVRDLALVDLLKQWNETVPVGQTTARALQSLVGTHMLSGFQARSTERILAAWEHHRSRKAHSSATIICAGTGSGKTMAFYLPGLASLVTDLLRNADPRVRILAIYPRTELLKDQFSEAWEQVRKVDEQLLSGGRRKVRIGALFAETPTAARYAIRDGKDYFHYRFLHCPTANCRGEMRWARTDIAHNRERLVCSRCGVITEGDEVALTREAMVTRPPDILFTTTEMLNQRIGDSEYRHLFGIGVADALPLVLLDEVHTYTGSSGAQTALLLSRWMHASGNRPHFVGLSATLRDAINFFSVLTSTNRTRVALVEPGAAEMFEASAEYLLALRGDPVSQTALLSTTIQTAMLTRRILDNARNLRSDGVWGSKTFLFTDDLDVNNRLYANLADAEGWRQRGESLVPNGQGPLAQYRNPTTSAEAPRKLVNLGQDWSVAKAIGFGLDQSDLALVSRTSSQDSGYDRDAEIIVTTASLEVGFNDTSVGAVIQHKAPRGVASYLQRKGRAGRPIVMRPWMIVVLSDFGRDRIAYQQYENLIEPEIKASRLPVGNIHILKIQAAQAVLDWLSQKFSNARMWNWLNRAPASSDADRRRMAELLESAMASGPVQEELRNYIGSALGVSETVLDKVFWQAPRSIVMEFLPTLQRRLDTNWAAWSEREQRIQELAEGPTAWGSPVPEFIPDNLFSPLDTPDLQIRLQRRNGDRWVSMGYFQGIREFAPGRISKRFAIESGTLSDWVVPETFDPHMVAGAVQFEFREAFGEPSPIIATLPRTERNDSLTVLQPRRVLAQSMIANREIGDTSNAFVRWQSKFSAPDAGEVHEVPSASNWKRWLGSVTFLTHGAMAPLEVIRYSTGSDATIKFRDGTAQDIQFEWVDAGKPVAVGARLNVDAVRFQFDFTQMQLMEWLSEESTQKAVRASILQDHLAREPSLGGDTFLSNWVFECFLTAILCEVTIGKRTVRDAISAVCDDQSAVRLDVVPAFLFQMDWQVATTGADDDSLKEQKLQGQLRAVLKDPAVRSSLRNLGSILYVPIGQIAGLEDWSLEVLGNTLAAALQQAVCVLLPHADEQSLVVDPDRKQDQGDGLLVWLSEADSGGMGIVAELRDLFTTDPLSVLNAIYRCLQPGDYEQLDEDLFAALEEVQSDVELARAFEDYRKAETYGQRLEASREVRATLANRGFAVTHTFAAVLNSRVLKAGTTAGSDRQLHGYLASWREIEENCQFEAPINVVSAVFARAEDHVGDPRVVFERTCAIQSILWVRGSTVRRASLGFYNRFRPDNNRTERLLGRLLCLDSAPEIIYTEKDWLQRLHKALDQSGTADLVIDRRQSVAIPRVLAQLHVKPMDTHGLMLYPRVRSFLRLANEMRFRIELPEAIY